MKISYSLDQISQPNKPIALTIGNFDGVHLGHQALLNRLKEVTPYATVVTFSNHPSEVLHKRPITYLTTLAHRLTLFETIGINEVLLIPFSKSFAQQTAREFLLKLKTKIPFSYLILGHDAVLGADRNRNLYALAQEHVFSLEYLEAAQINGTIISSSEIRKSIQSGNLEHAGKLLGRPYSIFASVEHGQGKGGMLGFHTANLPVEELALPPLGVYTVDVKVNGITYPAVANLGHAPTLHQNRKPCLEVHLIDEKKDLYGQDLEVFFLKYLRPEKRFATLDALKTQISQDIQFAKEAFTKCT